MRSTAVTLANGTVIHYTLILPPNYQAGQPYPTLLTLPLAARRRGWSMPAWNPTGGLSQQP